MLKSVRNFSFVALSFIISLSIVPLVMQTVKAEEVPTPVTIHNVAYVDVYNYHRNDLYSFVTNIENDTQWWLGVAETFVVQQGNPQTGVGTVYVQRGYFGDAPF